MFSSAGFSLEPTPTYLVSRKIYFPESYGATGDGTTDDTSDLNEIPSGAKEIFFKPNATYLISKEVNIFDSNTIIKGNFATIKRKDAVKTELAQVAVLGTTQLYVNSVTGWSIGDTVVVTNNAAATYAGKGDTENSVRSSDLDTVTAIDTVNKILTITNSSLAGLRLPQNGELNAAGQYAIGSNVVRVHNLWNLGNANNNIVVKNLIIDGNRSGNDFTYDWRINNTGALKGTQITFEGCIFKNTPSENITGSGQIWFKNCYIENTAGGIVHMSTATPTALKNGLWVTNCKGKNVGQKSAEAGHSEGFVTFSASVQEVFITGCYVENELNAGAKINSGNVFGNVNFEATIAETDGKVFVSGNRFVNFKNIASIRSDTADLNQNIQKIFIDNNEFENCGDLLIYGNAITNGGGIRKVRIRGNDITNGRIFAQEVYDLQITSNNLIQEETYSFPSNIIGISNTNTVAHIFILASKVKIENNTIAGKTTNDDYCKKGIMSATSIPAKDSGGVATRYCYYQDVSIKNNTIRNHHENEIITSNVTTATDRIIELVGWSIEGNHLYAQKSATTEQVLVVDPGVKCHGNFVYTFLSGQYGILTMGIRSDGTRETLLRGVSCKFNEVYGPSTNPIRSAISSNLYNNIVEYNQTQLAIVEASANNSIVRNNTLINTTGTPYYINENEDSGVY